jgi:hypothetical protein
MSKPILTQEILRELLDYDPETGVFVWKPRDRKWFQSDHSWKTWNARFPGRKAGGRKTRNGYSIFAIFGRHYYAHRLAWLYAYGAWPAGDVDHINHKRADNSIFNLRLATRSQNMANSSRTTGRSQHRGVIWNKQKQKWQARVKRSGRTHHAGFFDGEAEAARARNELAAFLHGEFACPSVKQLADSA